MAVRVRLLLRDPPAQRRLRRALEALDSVVLLPPGPAAPPEGCDLLVLGEEEAAAALPPLCPDERLPGVQEASAPGVVVLCTSAEASVRSAWTARGAVAVLGRGDEVPLLKATFAWLLARHRKEALGRDGPGRALDEPAAELRSASPRMQAFLELVRKVRPSDTSLLVVGETGSGKEHLARYLHRHGPRAAGPFVAVNCAAIPTALLESELFGHEKGAFTGADRERRGRFELADGGTLLLDEVAELPSALQAKLLRALQEREIERLGSATAIPVDLRVIAATHRDLEEEVQEGRFRSDLYFRLAVVTLRVPPLRERPEDIPALAELYLERFARQQGRRSTPTLDARAREALVSHAWPGNVRELINVMERAVLLSEGETIGMADLPEGLLLGPWLRRSAPAAEARPLPAAQERTQAARHLLEDTLSSLAEGEGVARRPWAEVRTAVVARLERWYLEAVLTATEGRVGEAAARMGLSVRALHTKMRAHGLDKRDYRLR